MNMWFKTLLAALTVAIFCSVAFAFEYKSYSYGEAKIAKTSSTTNVAYKNSNNFTICGDDTVTISKENHETRLNNFLVRHSAVSRLTLSQNRPLRPAAHKLRVELQPTVSLNRRCGHPS